MIARARLGLVSIPAWRWALYFDGAIGGIYTVLVGGTVLTGVILWAGGGAWELGLLSALTTGGGLLVVLTRRLQNRFGSHKELTRIGWTAARAAWLPLAILLGLLAFDRSIDRSIALPLVLLTAFAAAAFGGIGNVTWYSWCAALIPSSERGGFLAGRARALSVASLLSLPLIGVLLDATHAHQADALGFAVALSANALCAAFGWRLLSTPPASVAHDEARQGSRGKRPPSGGISAHRFALFTIVFQAGVYLSAPFFQAYAMERLGMSLGTLLNLQVIAQILPILTLGFWGRLSDRIGTRLPLGLCSLGKCVVPLCYLVATPVSWWPVFLVYVLSVLDAGITVTNGAAFADIAAGPQGGARVVQLNLLTSIAASITPVVAGYLVGNVTIAGTDLLVVAFVLSAVGRALSGIILLAPERARRARRARPPAVGLMLAE